MSSMHNNMWVYQPKISFTWAINFGVIQCGEARLTRIPVIVVALKIIVPITERSELEDYVKRRVFCRTPMT